MKRLDHLLFGVSEECAEISQRASKAARFGIKEVEPGQLLDNSQRIVQEYADLIGIMELLIEDGHITMPDLRQMIDNKKTKFERYLKYSAIMGTLDERD